jgi:proteasome lid subunit RPN8/RPN11
LGKIPATGHLVRSGYDLIYVEIFIPFPKVAKPLSSEGWADLSTPFRLLVPQTLYDQMLAQARAELPNECCGFLAGKVMEPDRPGDPPRGQVLCRYPLVNEAASPVEYFSASRSLFDAHRDMRRQGIDILAVYHSHPASDPVPSRKDRQNNLYGPDVVHLIISLKGSKPLTRGWWLTPEDYREAEWEICPCSQGG